MDIKELEKAAEPEEFAGFIETLPQPDHHVHGSGGSIETLREDDYEGHHIVIRTTYQIEVDGQVLQGPLGLDNEGNLHCHALPNYQFASAIDMVKRLIDNFPEDFKSKKGGGKKTGGHTGGHAGAHSSHTAQSSRKAQKRGKKGGK